MPHPPTLARTHTRLAGTALVVLSGAAFGTMPIMAKVAYHAGAEPFALLAVRFTVGAALLALIRVRTQPGMPWPRGRTLAALFALGAVGYVVESAAYFLALEHLPAALVAILLYLYPAIVVLLAVVFLGQRPSWLVAGCLVLAVAGSALTVGPVRGTVSTLGVGLGVFAATSYAVYIVLSASVVPRVGALTSITVVAAGAAVTYDVLALATGSALPRDGGGWLAAFGVAVFGTVIAMLAFFAGLARLGPADSSVLSTVEPVVTAGLGVLVLHEGLSVVQVTGAGLVLATVAVLARSQSTGASHPVD
ncbi:MAG TPA: DMT family transporter [Mycobacteriales bacterium]|nr:DMT family transporter [Mycobacteriales bacterium]